jgi:hypothetical protein
MFDGWQKNFGSTRGSPPFGNIEARWSRTRLVMYKAIDSPGALADWAQVRDDASLRQTCGPVGELLKSIHHKTQAIHLPMYWF